MASSTYRLATAVVACCLSVSLPARAERAAQQPIAVAGIWDLTWQKRSGPEKNGFLILRQKGAELAAEIHGQGSVRAEGRMAGDSFTLRGSRMAIPYTIRGRVEAGRLVGSLKILSVERSFTGTRRLSN